MKININSLKLNNLNNICTNIKVDFLLIDQRFLIVKRLNYVNHVLQKNILKINDINTTTLFTNKYIFVAFFIFNEIIDKQLLFVLRVTCILLIILKRIFF